MFYHSKFYFQFKDTNKKNENDEDNENNDDGEHDEKSVEEMSLIEFNNIEIKEGFVNVNILCSS